MPGQSCAASAASVSGLKRDGRRDRIALAGELEEALDERRNVFAPAAERRNVHRHDGQTEVQVFAELAALDLGLEVALGGGDDARFGCDRLVAADAPEFARLEHAQELRLHVERQLADLVEEERALPASSNAPWREATAPVNAPRSWPKSSLSMSE